MVYMCPLESLEEGWERACKHVNRNELVKQG